MFFALAPAVTGCGDDDGVPATDAGVRVDAATGDAGPPRDAGVPPDAAGLDAGPSTDAGLSTDAGSPTDAGSATDAGPPYDAATSAVVTITDFFAGSNCMPPVIADPVRATWTVHVSGAAGAAATVTEATLVVDTGAVPFMQSLTLVSTTIPLTAGAGSAAQSKMSGTPVPTGACAAAFCAATTSHLALTVAVDGVPIMVAADGTYGCTS